MIKYALILLLYLYSSISYGQEGHQDWTQTIYLTNLEKINSEHTEFSPAYWNDFIIYVASRPRKKLIDLKLKEAYFDLYYAAGKSPQALDKSALLSKKLNTSYHEGPVSFDPVNQKLYFTRVDYDGKDLKMNEDKIVTNKIFESQFTDGEWTNVEKSNFNIENYASCHPTIDLKNQIVIFASDRPGGFGKMDLYYSKISDGHWSEPVNLGPEINTSKNEIFPFISESGFLFFASENSTKKADLDIYRAEVIEKSFRNKTKLPYPINSQYDDFGLITDTDGISGYLSSNRPGGKGKDDIYFFQSQKSIFGFNNEAYNTIQILIKDQNSLSLSEVPIHFKHISKDEFDAFDESIFSIEKESQNLVTTDSTGQARINMLESHLLIKINSQDKEVWQKIISRSEIESVLEVILNQRAKKDSITELIPEESQRKEPIKSVINNVNLNVGAVLVFNNIYYDYNSHEIKRGAAYELDQLAEAMLRNPKLKVQLSAHTDSRGESQYNKSLSEKRAQSAKYYLIKKGVEASKIITRGFGETQLRNHCKDGIQCSDAEHVHNRRTEVKVLEN